MIDDDGRITVAPEALAVPLQLDVTAPSTPVDLKPSATPCTFRQTTPLRHRFQHLSIGSSPFLSPFRASLQKLKEMAKAPLSQPQASILTDTTSDDSTESVAVGSWDLNILLSFEIVFDFFNDYFLL